MPAPTTSTSTAMSSFNAENRGAGALSIQYELVSMLAITRVMQAVGRVLGALGASGALGARGAKQIVAEGPQCLAAMTDGGLVVVGHLSECSTVGRVKKDGVVAEAVPTGRFFGKQSFYVRGCLEPDF